MAETMRPDFDGKTYDREKDHERLWTALEAVEDLLSKGNWHTLRDIQRRLERDYGVMASESGISARFRDLRKEKFGGHKMISRRVEGGAWEYAMEPQPTFKLEFSP